MNKSMKNVYNNNIQNIPGEKKIFGKKYAR